MTIDDIREIAKIALENGIAVASHDDDTYEKLELVKSLGTTLSEFPITIDIAKRAREMGLYTIGGAPNILLGGSHSGNLSAAESILNEATDILCSDYYPPAMLHAVFAMHKKYELGLCQMFKLVTINPAKAVNMGHEIGSIKEGKKADVMIIEIIENDFPVITTVFVDGRLNLKTNYNV